MKKIKILDIIYYYMPNISIDKCSNYLFIIIIKYIFCRTLISEFWLKIFLASVNFKLGYQRGLRYIKKFFSLKL